MLKWFDAAAAEAQADEVVSEIGHIVPKSALEESGGGRKKQIAKLDQTIDRHRRKASVASYNIYKKAKFANRVKWKLRDEGYPDEFIDWVVRLLII